MTPLQKIAMGLLIVFLRAPFAGYDGLPDPIGWVLVLLGVAALRHVLSETVPLLLVAGTAGLVSVGVYWPAVADLLAPSAEWALSLPQLTFCVLLCHRLATVADPRAAGRFRGLRWAFVVLAIAPAVLYGGDVEALAVPLAVGITLADVYLVYLLFRAAGHETGPPPRGNGPALSESTLRREPRSG